jgi:hypothetical protein
MLLWADSEQVPACALHHQDWDPLLPGEPPLVHQLLHALLLPPLLPGLLEDHLFYFWQF